MDDYLYSWHTGYGFGAGLSGGKGCGLAGIDMIFEAYYIYQTSGDGESVGGENGQGGGITAKEGNGYSYELEEYMRVTNNG
jgi:hypothetical protein